MVVEIYKVLIYSIVESVESVEAFLLPKFSGSLLSNSPKKKAPTFTGQGFTPNK